MSEEKWWIEGGREAKFDAPIYCPTDNIRFWMKENSERKIVFLTDVVKLIIYEHSMRIGQHWRNYATCLRLLKQKCPLCETKNVNKYQVAPYTVIGLEPYEDKKGVKHTHTKRLLMAKGVTFEKLVRQQKKREEKEQSLKFAIYTVARLSGKKSCSCGDEFEFEEMTTEKALQDAGIDTAEFDYFKLLKPSPELVQKYVDQLGDYKTTDSEQGDSEPTYEIPF